MVGLGRPLPPITCPSCALQLDEVAGPRLKHCPGCGSELHREPPPSIVTISCPRCLMPLEGLTALRDGIHCPACGFTRSPESAPASRMSSQMLSTRFRRNRDAAAFDDTQIPLEWTPGEILLGIYQVVDVLGIGGMGTVYRVRHLLWDLDLAVKTPNLDLVAIPEAQQLYTREAENWVAVGYHPHVVSCYYVRRLGQCPRVFAEFVSGSDLYRLIKSGEVWAGTWEEAVTRALDLAVQFAWGLHHAHEQGIVHHDVKPANCMVTADGILKVTDFGLSRAISTHEEAPTGTPCYSSPEHLTGNVTFRSDMWSWAVSVLEMLTGYHPQWGGDAPEMLPMLEDPANPVAPVPPALIDLLRHCFERDPENRPADLAQVGDALIDIYQEVAGIRYPRTRPHGVAVRADSLNNRAISLIDLGRTEESLALLDEALSADPTHLHASFNRALMRWRQGEVSDDGVLQMLRTLETGPGRDAVSLQYLSGCVQMERGDSEAARHTFEALYRKTDDASLKAWIERTLQGHIEGFHQMAPIGSHEAALRACAVSPTGTLLATGGADCTLRLWSLTGASCVSVLRGCPAGVTAVGFTQEGLPVAATADGSVVLFRAQPQIVEVGEGALPALALPAEAHFGIVACGPRLYMLETAAGTLIRQLEGHQAPVLAMAATPDGRRCVSCDASGSMRIWDLSTGTSRLASGHHEGEISAVAISADGSVAVTGGRDGQLRCWNLDLLVSQRLLGHAGPVLSLAITADGGLAVSGGDDGTVRIWELSHGKLVRTLRGDGSWVTAVGFSEAVGCVVAGTANGAVLWWQLPGELQEAQLLVVRPSSSEAMLTAQGGYVAILAEAREALQQGDLELTLQALQDART
ncbi:MAG: protein kinase domain-containing protein, partial [Candidatus Xenobia bacterium]